MVALFLILLAYLDFLATLLASLYTPEESKREPPSESDVSSLREESSEDLSERSEGFPERPEELSTEEDIN
jgi:hypothetical protein